MENQLLEQQQHISCIYLWKYFFLVSLVIFPSVGAIALVTPTIGLQQRTIHSEWGYFCLYLCHIYINIFSFSNLYLCNIYIYISCQRMRKSCPTLESERRRNRILNVNSLSSSFSSYTKKSKKSYQLKKYF